MRLVFGRVRDGAEEAMLERPAREWDGVILADEPVGEGLEVCLSGVVGDEVDSGCGQCG